MPLHPAPSPSIHADILFRGSFPSLAVSDPESDRLAALRRSTVIDAVPEDAFDSVASLARTLFDVPGVLITFVGAARQWFKARRDWHGSEAPRTWPLCARTIEVAACVVVPDARLDACLFDTAPVAGAPGVRFCAGTPLRMPGGHCIGALCILSPEPRAGFSAEDQRRLEALADVAMRELELRLQAARVCGEAAEREMLLREVHHRVNNSLQLVSSVLQAQALRMQQPGLREELGKAADRVVSIGTVHRQLHRGRTVREEDVADYLAVLLRELRRGLVCGAGGREVALDAPPGLVRSAEMLSRIGLVVTELVTNALKHGAGRVEVWVRPDGGGTVVQVRDEGAGFPPGFDPSAQRGSLGLRLIAMLAGRDGVRIDSTDQRWLMVRLG